MLTKIPDNLKELYSSFGFIDKLYIRLRYRLCPFNKIESFVPKAGRILDVGCGYGLLANLISLRSAKREVFGIDSSSKRINVARGTIGARKNIQFELKNSDDIDLAKYDAVVMSDFLHHLSYHKQEELIKRVYEGLSYGGILIIQDIDTKPSWKYSFAYLIDVIFNLEVSNYRSLNNFVEMLTKIGFKVRSERIDKGVPLPDVIYICRK